MKKEETLALFKEHFPDLEVKEEVLNKINTRINTEIDTVRDNHFESEKGKLESTIAQNARENLFKEYGFDNEEAFKNAKTTYESTDNELKKQVNDLTKSLEEANGKNQEYEKNINDLNGKVFDFERKGSLRKLFKEDRIQDAFDLSRSRKTEENKFEEIDQNILKANPTWSKDYKGRNYTPPTLHERKGGEKARFGTRFGK